MCWLLVLDLSIIEAIDEEVGDSLLSPSMQRQKMFRCILLHRRLSVRECARIQTFPDSFIFEGTDIKAQYRMIGNAVPPRLGNILAKSIYVTLANLHPLVPTAQQRDNEMENSVLVGYFKSQEHKRLILQNRLYYVRSDGRMGSCLSSEGHPSDWKG